MAVILENVDKIITTKGTEHDMDNFGAGASKLGDLSDVHVPVPDDKDKLFYHNGTWYPENYRVTLTEEAVFTTVGTYSWLCPTDVTSVSVVCIGGGGGTNHQGNGGGGGGLGWKNNIPVVPGVNYTVVVGSGGVSGHWNDFTSTAGGDSSFIDDSTCVGYGGKAGMNDNGAGGGYVGDGGGNGGNGGVGYDGNGGGGTGGYSGNGGNGGNGSSHRGGNGGGVGLLGEGTSGNGGQPGPTNPSYNSGTAGQNGSGGGGGGGGGGNAHQGNDGTAGSGGSGNLYGGGNGLFFNDEIAAHGAVRIIWGTGRSFPNNAG